MNDLGITLLGVAWLGATLVLAPIVGRWLARNGWPHDRDRCRVCQERVAEAAKLAGSRTRHPSHEGLS